CTRGSTCFPAPGDWPSASIWSVEIEQLIAARSTCSPSALRHSTTVPSETDTPSCGMTTSISAVLEELTARLPDAVDGRQQGLLERRREGDRDVGRRDAHHRPVEVLEAVLRDQGGD